MAIHRGPRLEEARATFQHHASCSCQLYEGGFELATLDLAEAKEGFEMETQRKMSLCTRVEGAGKENGGEGQNPTLRARACIEAVPDAT